MGLEMNKENFEWLCMWVEWTKLGLVYL
jgi:hypothetical protein